MANITKANFNFLNKLSTNNNREWFAENKSKYIEQHENMIAFADSLLQKISTHDLIETPTGKKSLYRIYRDVRFSKNKAPYKTHWSGGFKRATNKLRGGYYFHIEPGNKSMVAGGFWGPNKDDLARIREELATDPNELRSIITEKNFVDHFETLKGEQLKTAPKGFPKDHPSIDLLRFKQFIFFKSFSDEEVLQDDFADKLNESFIAMRPFMDYMSDVLTTDSNGTPIV